MYQLSTLKNGLTLITVNLPYLDSVTTLIAVGAGSRYENKKNNGISHFLEHMAFKGTKKYPTAEIISTMIDSIGAVQNAATSKEYTFYFIKSSAKQLKLANDVLSSLIVEPLLAEEEIEREKGVITEEIRMYQDTPSRLIWDLYERLQFGDQPLGWRLDGGEEIINSFQREDFIRYMEALYSPKNMALVVVGKLPDDVETLAEKYFLDLPERTHHKFEPYRREKQKRLKVHIFQKKTDQAHIILGVEGYGRYDSRKYIADVLSTILGTGFSSRLFMQIRERRGLAYHIIAGHELYVDTGALIVHAGLKLEKIREGLEIIKTELLKTTSEKVTDEELKKAKEIIRGRLAIRLESTSFLAEYFGTEFVLDRKIETFEEYLKKIDAVTAEEVQQVAKELFQPQRFNLQIIGPFKDPALFEKLLK